MKPLFMITLVMLSVFAMQAQDTTRILFIGNSITYFNDMPQTVEDIANSQGKPTAVTMFAPGGHGVEQHANKPFVYEYFRQGNWDFVVLQPSSGESSGYSQPIESTLGWLRILEDSVFTYSPCAKILYYEISYTVWGDSPENLITYNNDMDQLRSNVEYWADSTELFFAPAGEALKTAWNADQTNSFWGEFGNVHPNEKGSYVIACTIFSSIFQAPSLGSDITNTLTAEEAESYQILADSTVLNHLSNWRINTYNQHTDFDFTLEQSMASFHSTSQNIDSLHWDFGDESGSSQPTINHEYAELGTYEVSLTTFHNGCTEVVTQTVDLSVVETDEPAPQSWLAYPNPFSESIIIKDCLLPLKAISIYNITGQNCGYSISIRKAGNNVEIDTHLLPKGSYVLKIGHLAQMLIRL